jgi:hypothetical protein
MFSNFLIQKGVLAAESVSRFNPSAFSRQV